MKRTDPSDFERSYQGQLFEALDAPSTEAFRAFVMRLKADPVRSGEFWGSLPEGAWGPKRRLIALCHRFAMLRGGDPVQLDARTELQWSSDNWAHDRGYLRAYLRGADASCYVAPTESLAPASCAMQLRARALPAQVIVTLHNHGPLNRAQLKSSAGGSEQRVANLLAPNGDLCSRGLIRADGDRLELTSAGRREAHEQVKAGTEELGAS